MAREPERQDQGGDVAPEELEEPGGLVGQVADFNTRHGARVKDVFTKIVQDALAKGEQPEAQARVYAALGKPDFTLAYLVVAALPEGEKCELLASAYERRATYTEEKARDFDRKFHRPFPLLFTEAAKDRATARQVRAGRPIRAEGDRQLPTA